MFQNTVATSERLRNCSMRTPPINILQGKLDIFLFAKQLGYETSGAKNIFKQIVQIFSIIFMDETAEVNNGKSVQIFKYRLPKMCEKSCYCVE